MRKLWVVITCCLHLLSGQASAQHNQLRPGVDGADGRAGQRICSPRDRLRILGRRRRVSSRPTVPLVAAGHRSPGRRLHARKRGHNALCRRRDRRGRATFSPTQPTASRPTSTTPDVAPAHRRRHKWDIYEWSSGSLSLVSGRTTGAPTGDVSKRSVLLTGRRYRTTASRVFLPAGSPRRQRTPTKRRRLRAVGRGDAPAQHGTAGGTGTPRSRDAASTDGSRVLLRDVRSRWRSTEPEQRGPHRYPPGNRAHAVLPGSQRTAGAILHDARVARPRTRTPTRAFAPSWAAWTSTSTPGRADPDGCPRTSTARAEDRSRPTSRRSTTGSTSSSRRRAPRA